MNIQTLPKLAEIVEFSGFALALLLNRRLHMEQALNQQDFPRLKQGLGDQAYGKCCLPEWVKEHGYYELEITGKDQKQKG